MKLKRLIPSILSVAVAGMVLPLPSLAEDVDHPKPVHAENTDNPPHQLPAAEAPHAHVEKFGGTGHERRFGTLEQRWKERLADAGRLEKVGKDDEAENVYYELIAPPYSDSLNKDAYPILIEFYEKRGKRVKLIELYEQFSEKYPDDPELPEIYFRLGNLYREFGAYELAQTRYYKVLSTGLRSVRSDAEKQEYRHTSLRAQIEIANLFLELGDHVQANEYFDRLLRLEDLDSPGSTTNRARTEFKRAYSKYNVAKGLDDKVKALNEEFKGYILKQAEEAKASKEEDAPGNTPVPKDARTQTLEERQKRAKDERNKALAQIVAYLLDCGSRQKPFYEAYPDNEHAPESHYLLATVYKLQGTEDSKMKAHNQVVMLLDKANRGIRANKVTLREPATSLKSKKDQTSDYHWDKEEEVWKDADGEEVNEETLGEISNQVDQWVRWQKKAGNQLANEYFENGETEKAIGIYQKMLGLDSTPKWQAPIVYQLGLCFERLGGASYNPKAIEAYEILTNPSKNPKNWGTWSKNTEDAIGQTNKSVDPNLVGILQNQEQFIYRMALWRLKNLRWNLAATNEVKRLEKN